MAEPTEKRGWMPPPWKLYDATKEAGRLLTPISLVPEAPVESENDATEEDEVSDGVGE